MYYRVVLIAFTLFFTSHSIANKIEMTSKEVLCKSLAEYYAKGNSYHWFKIIAEIKKRKYTLECKEYAELEMASYNNHSKLNSFKIKLDEMFGVTPDMYSEKYFIK